MLLTADLHLDDKPSNEYRWGIFDTLKQHAASDIHILGDLTDRADRHSGLLVNRLVTELSRLASQEHTVTILQGNHDRGLRAPWFWQFLNELPYVTYVTEPRQMGDLLLLPYSPNPIEDWKDVQFEKFKVCFIHQTVRGAALGNGIVAGHNNLPALPANLRVYSGDVHTPQTVSGVTYVGAPYPVKFGDTYKTRILLLDQQYREREVILDTIHKDIIEITNPKQLEKLNIPSGSQVRVRLTMPSARVDGWPVEEAAIAEWARERGVVVVSAEAIIETTPDRSQQQYDFDADPEQVLQAFCRAEGVDVEIYQTGLEILRSLH